MEKVSKVQLKKVWDLMRDKKARDDAGMFVAEGAKIVSDILAKDHDVESIIVSRKFISNEENEAVLQRMDGGLTPLYVAGNIEFERVSWLQNSRGILAVVKKPFYGEIMSALGKSKLMVLCDGIQDPGNIGAIIRTSVAFGVDSILTLGDTVDVYNPKVVRASSGMMIDLPIHESCFKDLEQFKKNGYKIFASQLGRIDSKDINEIKNVSGAVIVVFGSEGKGVSDEVLDKADESFYIPISENAESLNVGAAAAIALYVLSQNKN